MSESNKQKQDKIKLLLVDLNSGDQAKIAKAIPALELNGDASVILPLLEIWNKGLNTANEKAVIELLSGLKDTSTVEPLMEAFRSAQFTKLKRQLVVIFWNSKLDFSTYLADFVLFALEGDFLDVLEVVTLIEQFESAIPEHAVMESQLLLKEYYNGTENRERQKDELLAVVAEFVRQFEQEADLEHDFGFDYEEEEN